MIALSLLALMMPMSAGLALAAGDDGLRARGAYLVQAAGCKACHTVKATKTTKAGPAYAGGRALKTPFGIYYSPNITPDKMTGIGGWSDADFLRALQLGKSPKGEHYFPVFPYTSYTKMSRADALAIKAFLFSLPARRNLNKRHDVPAPFSWRWTMIFWKVLFFSPGRFDPDMSRSPAHNRGAYLVTALSHCGECHSPRNILGAVDADMFLAGNRDGPDDELVPNITPDKATGIGNWDTDEIVELLKNGIKPGFDDVQGAMAETIENGLGRLRDADLRAIAVYLRALPAIRNKIGREKQ